MALKLTVFYKDCVTDVRDVEDQTQGELLAQWAVHRPGDKALLWDDAKDKEGAGLTGFEPDTWKFRAWFGDETQTVKTEYNKDSHAPHARI